MLKYLHIENIAVIERSDIEFTSGFNVLTGETGAGKSIVIDSINAVLGERTSKDLIRAGCKEAEVSALFGEISDENIKFLESLDIFPDEDGNILITRKLSAAGKGMIKVNSKPVTASTLREIAAALINIHGQHDNQALLNPDTHCGFLDALAENEAELNKYYTEFKSLNNIRRELTSLETDEDEKRHKSDLLKFQIDELTKADIKPGEISRLKEQLKIAEEYETALKALSKASLLLSGDEEYDGAVNSLKFATKEIAPLNGDEFQKSFNRLNAVISETEDISADIADYLDSLQNSPADTDKINKRLDELQRLMVKYGSSEEEMLRFLENAVAESEKIDGADARIEELSRQLEKSKLRLIEYADILSATRKKAAERFEKEVGDILRELNMPSVAFKVAFGEGRYTKRGKDVVEFIISANKGENLKPLAKIASGGELSRTMLAVKSALIDKDGVETMIFDEIDSGISGYTADKVASRLKILSLGRQVICVTHLAQIAARADNHLLIEKDTENGRTFTHVFSLGYDERIKEIARIMSGTEITRNLYNSAKELLDRSYNNDGL